MFPASFNDTDINEDLERYGANKREQNKIIEDPLEFMVHILNVILGCTDTRLSEDPEGDKLTR